MTTETDHARTGARAGAPRVLLVLESFPPALPPGGEALPEGSIWFYAACRRWGVAPDLLATALRINALDRPPAGNWYPRARARVRAALLECRPEAVVAAGRVARSAVRGALGLPPGAWNGWSRWTPPFRGRAAARFGRWPCRTSPAGPAC